MDEGQVQQATVSDLRAWDWRAELERQERSMSWLAKHTGRTASAVYKFGSGELQPSIDWLKTAAAVLKVVPS